MANKTLKLISGGEALPIKLLDNGDGTYSVAALSVVAMDIELIDVSGTTEYYGTAPAGTATSAAGWQIQRKSVSGSVTSFLWVDGNILFDNVWDDRATLAYS